MSARFGYTVVWVPDVERTVLFYEQAFGLERRSIEQHGSTIWAEMETGTTTLAFASQSEAELLFADGFHANSPANTPSAILLSFVVEDVNAVYRQALAAGATERDKPKVEPWGQTVARLRDLNGVLVSLASARKAKG